MILLRVFLLLLLTAAPSLAWWHEGHQLVVLLAQDHLSHGTQIEISEILSHHPDPTVRSLKSASTWPDLIKDEDHPFHHHDRSDWHYINRPIPDSSAGQSHGKLVEQLKKQGDILADKDKPKAQRAVALSWYVHLVGDIHQPLHNVNYYSEDFPKGDLGGNRFDVVLGSQAISLHILWDSIGGRFIEKPPVGRLRSYNRAFQKDWPIAKMTEETQVGDPQAWSNEGLSLCRHRIYPQVHQRAPISITALQDTLDLTKKQLCLAGYRLALQLNRRLD